MMLILKVFAVTVLNLVSLSSGASFKSLVLLMVNIRKTECIYIHSYLCGILLLAYAMNGLKAIQFHW